MPKNDFPEHRFRFAERWARKRVERSPRAIWITLVLDMILIAIIFGMVYISLRSWK